MKQRNRAESRTPAMPITRCLGKPVLRADKVGHDVERIAHHDDDGSGRMLLHVVGHAADDLRSFSIGGRRGSCRAAGEAAGDDTISEPA